MNVAKGGDPETIESDGPGGKVNAVLHNNQRVRLNQKGLAPQEPGPQNEYGGNPNKEAVTQGADGHHFGV